MFRKIKSVLNRFGLDIRRYNPPYATLIKQHGIGTVLDVGANTGQFAAKIFKESPSVKVISFEPVHDCFVELTKNIQGRGESFKAMNMALGDTNEETFINRSSFTPSSSLLPVSNELKSNYPKSVESTQEKIMVKRLDDVYPKLSTTPNLLIKIDVQGFEDKVIMGGRETISKAKVLIIETSFVALYEGQSLFDDIYKTMKELGFKYYGDIERHYNKNKSELLYEDSIFIKK